MRVDKLNDKQFWEAYKFFTQFIGEEATREYIKNGTIMEEMKRFECVVWDDNGSLGPADDVYELEMLQELEEFPCALAYAVDLAKEYEWDYKSFEDLCEVLEEKGVVFDDYGNPGWVDIDEPSNLGMVSEMVDGLKKSIGDFATLIDSKTIKTAEVETGFNPHFDRTEMYLWVVFTDGSCATIPVGWYQGEAEEEATEEYKNGKILGMCEV